MEPDLVSERSSSAKSERSTKTASCALTLWFRLQRFVSRRLFYFRKYIVRKGVNEVQRPADHYCNVVFAAFVSIPKPITFQIHIFYLYLASFVSVLYNVQRRVNESMILWYPIGALFVYHDGVYFLVGVRHRRGALQCYPVSPPTGGEHRRDLLYRQ